MLVWFLGVSDGFFRIDDYQYFEEASRLGGHSQAWLTSVYYQHFAPFHRLVFGVTTHATVQAWYAVFLFQLALMGLGLLAYYGCMELLFGRSWWLLVPLALVGSSIWFVFPLIWPSAGLQAIPDFTAGTTCLYGFLRAHQTGRK